MALKTEKLKRPSVIEAVCEFRFSAGVSYTLIPGGMRERLKRRFPVYEVLPAASFLGPLPEEIAPPAVPHHRFRSQFPNSLVQTGPRLLTVNVLPVYPTFEVFRELVLEALKAYRDVAESGDPTSVGLRYINHIPHSEGGDSVDSYFKWSVAYPDNLHHPPEESAARIVLRYPDIGNLSVAVSFPAQVGTGELGALLDIGLTQAEPGSFDRDKFPDWLDRAHDTIYETFMSTVLDKILQARRWFEKEVRMLSQSPRLVDPLLASVIFAPAARNQALSSVTTNKGVSEALAFEWIMGQNEESIGQILRSRWRDIDVKQFLSAFCSQLDVLATRGFAPLATVRAELPNHVPSRSFPFAAHFNLVALPVMEGLSFDVDDFVEH